MAEMTEEEFEGLFPPASTEESTGKILVDEIKAACRKFVAEFEANPNLVLIHPGDLRFIQLYAYRYEMFTYIPPNGGPRILPNMPELEMMLDYCRARGTFLVTTRKNLNRAGVVSDVNKEN